MPLDTRTRPPAAPRPAVYHGEKLFSRFWPRAETRGIYLESKLIEHVLGLSHPWNALPPGYEAGFFFFSYGTLNNGCTPCPTTTTASAGCLEIQDTGTKWVSTVSSALWSDNETKTLPAIMKKKVFFRRAEGKWKLEWPSPHLFSSSPFVSPALLCTEEKKIQIQSLIQSGGFFQGNGLLKISIWPNLLRIEC